jgi:hypothetical protein
MDERVGMLKAEREDEGSAEDEDAAADKERGGVRSGGFGRRKGRRRRDSDSEDDNEEEGEESEEEGDEEDPSGRRGHGWESSARSSQLPPLACGATGASQIPLSAFKNLGRWKGAAAVAPEEGGGHGSLA